MSDVSREEFDELVARVDRIEPTTHALVEIASAELVGIRSEIRDRFAHVDGRLGGVESRLGGVESRLAGVGDRLGGVEGRLGGVEGRLEDYRHEVLVYAEQLRGYRDEVGGYNERVLSYNEQVSTAIRVGSEAAERHEAVMRRLYDHFGISEN